MLKQKIVPPEIDVCRVEMIRNQLDEDEYLMDIQQIADKIIDIEMALLGKE